MSEYLKLSRVLHCHDSGPQRRLYVFHCPGCGYQHSYNVGEAYEHPRRWEFNGDAERPSFTPSLLVNAHHPPSRCHLFVTHGKIHYCGDCHHKLAGQTVDMVPLEDT